MSNILNIAQGPAAAPSSGGRNGATYSAEDHPRRGAGARTERIAMGRLAQTDGLTDVQTEILGAVHEFVEKEIIPVAQELEHADEYPSDIVEGMKDMGIFGLMIPEEYGGLGESLLTYALTVEEIARGWMSVTRDHQHALHRRLHGHAARHRGAEAALPAEDGDRRDPWRVLDVRAALRLRRRGDPQPRRCATATSSSSTARRCGSPTVGSSTLVAVLVRTDGEADRGRERLQEDDDVPGREAGRVRRGAARVSRSRARSTRWATRASTPPSW